ncbi:MAG TPA: ABC transporter permease [Thermoanaerobaculia bacterium]|nr:ABC transporter permease [Thermoanaerobaculia bacterium]
MSSLLQDLKFALRTFVKSPGFAAIAVVTLALGIGANAAIFALVNRVMLTLLPVRNPKELVLLRSDGPIQGHGWSDDDIATSFTYPMYRNLRDGNTVFSGLLAQFPFDASVAAAGATERASAEMVSANAFGVLGVPPALGRVLDPADDRAPGVSPVVVLSHGYWKRRFAADPGILNKAIIVNGHPLTIVGVAREGFSGIEPGRPADMFVPIMEKAQMTQFWNGLDDPKDYWVQIVGRLKPGLSRAEAQARLGPLYRSLLRDALASITDWNDKNRNRFLDKKLELLPGGTGRAVMRNAIGTPLLALMGMVGLVLLIACSNLAGLLAARGAARQREYGIRLAIGASRVQLLRQTIAECLVFSFFGGALGLAVAAWTLDALLAAFPQDGYLRQLAIHVDPRVITFAGTISVVSAFLFAIAPALRAARLDPASTLGGSGRGTSTAGHETLRFRRWLVTAQIALTLVLLVAAGLFVRTLQNLGRVELGLQPDRVIGFTVAPEASGYTAEKTALFGRQLIGSLAALPGVRSVTAAEVPTLAGDDEGGNIKVAGFEPGPGESTHVQRNRVAPDYFSSLGIPLLKGRELTWQDDAGSPKVALINETLARKFFGNRDPLGGKVGIGGGDKVQADIEIVGVVKDSKGSSVDGKIEPFLYLPWQQDPKLGRLTFYVRSVNDPASLTTSLRAAVHHLDAQLPIFDLKTLRTQIAESLTSRRLVMILSAAFGALAALLSALGIYGVLAFAVAQRRIEIGVRVALGATPGEVRGLVLADVGRFLAIGCAVGLPAAFALGKAVQSILYGVRAADAPIFAAGIAILGAVAFAAAYPSAHRAARLDPMRALRSE